MKVLVDIGNTRIKWAIEAKGIVKNSLAINHQANFIEHIKESWSLIECPDILAISSVSKQHIVDELVTEAKILWPNIRVVIAKSSAQALSITNAYEEASKLGVDRWLGLIALQHYYPENACVIDCGTAITIDVLNDKGLHLGGLISPGLQLMKRSLFQGAENLSNVEQQFSVGLSDTTDSAIFSGTLLAATGLIDKVISEFCCSAKTIVLTGGDAELISKHLNYKVIIENDFVLEGLSLYSSGRVQ